MNQADIHLVKVPEYKIPEINQFSGEQHYSPFGHPIAIEYWQNRPDFEAISIPIIQFLRAHYLHQMIGIRMLGSMLHPDITLDQLIQTILKLGHDRYDNKRPDNSYKNTDLYATELFMLETKVGFYEGLNGEEQIMHALNSFYVYPESPVRIDIVILYDLSKFEHTEIVFAGKKQTGHIFKYPDQKPAAILDILKIE